MATLEESVTPWGAANKTVSGFLWGIEDDFLLNQLAQLQISVLQVYKTHVIDLQFIISQNSALNLFTKLMINYIDLQLGQLV